MTTLVFLHILNLNIAYCTGEERNVPAKSFFAETGRLVQAPEKACRKRSPGVRRRKPPRVVRVTEWSKRRCFLKGRRNLGGTTESCLLSDTDTDAFVPFRTGRFSFACDTSAMNKITGGIPYEMDRTKRAARKIPVLL